MGHRAGFTLIEVTVALAIMFIVLMAVLSTVVFVYRANAQTERVNIAKNVATYVSEYLRSRAATHTSDLATYLGVGSSGVFGWHADTNTSGTFPAIVDPWNLPLQSYAQACSFEWQYARTHSNSAEDGQTADGRTIRYSCLHAALPSENYNDCPWAFTFVLQGYASVRSLGTLPGGGTSPEVSAVDPAPEDANLHITPAADAVGGLIGHYETQTGGDHPLIIFPGTYLGAGDIREFRAQTGYVPLVYTGDASRVVDSSPMYNALCSTDAGTREATMNYSGYRVLLRIVARTTDTVNRHLEYYDVSIAVLYNNGGKEASYELQTKIGVF